MAAFRIVQESSPTCVKHAGPVPTTVELAYTPTSVEVVVANEGRGVESHQPGFGLAGMSERAAFVGGTLVGRGRGSTAGSASTRCFRRRSSTRDPGDRRR